MTTFRRFGEYVDAVRKARPAAGATYSQVVTALAGAGFVGATAKELETLIDHHRGFTETRRERTTLLDESVELMKKNGVVRDLEFGSAAISKILPADDVRGQTVLYDLIQFEADVKEAAQRLGKAVPPLLSFDAEMTADNVFAWVYALRAGLLPPPAA
jgi:hypothetical protein